MNAGYTSRMYRRRPEDTREAKSFFILPEPPQETRMGGAFAVEGDRWHISLGGWIGDHAPADEEGFLEFARSLPSPEIYNIIKHREPLTDFSVHKFPANQRRFYEKLKRFPEGYLVIGDAICSFNPIYGQGMSISAMQTDTLDNLLRNRKNLQGLWKKFFKQTAKVVDVAWMMSAAEDFRYPEVKGKKPAGTAFINWYMGKLHRAATRDPEVCRAFFKMMNLLSPPALAFDPRIIFRVIKDSFMPQPTKSKFPMRPAQAQE
jgi:flavin-dependent dehydrogenase